jgi:CP family cyanate transporter-like MFS transporter
VNAPSEVEHRTHPGATAAGTVVLIALVAIALRPPFTSVAPLLDHILRDLHLSTAFGGLLTTLPVVCLGAFAFVAPKLRQRWGDERVILGCLVVLVVGNLLRAMGSVGTLLAGTTVLGVGVAVANVAVPGLIKRDFPHRVPTVTAAYTTCLTLGGAAAAAFVVPLGNVVGSPWRAPLGMLTVPVLVALVLSVVVLRGRSAGPPSVAIRPAGLWRDPLAWQVTAFMGLQSLLAYITFGWLPSMAQSRGMSPELAGLLLGMQAAIQAAGSMTVPLLCRRLRDQRWIAAAVAVLSALGFTGIILGPAPGGVWGATVVLGVAQGAGFGLGLTMFGLRSPDSDTTAALSGMGQGTGYLIAACGPLAVGVVHALTGNWTAPLVLVLAVCAVELVAGLFAGRPLQVASVTDASR